MFFGTTDSRYLNKLEIVLTLSKKRPVMKQPKIRYISFWV